LIHYALNGFIEDKGGKMADNPKNNGEKGKKNGSEQENPTNSTSQDSKTKKSCLEKFTGGLKTFIEWIFKISLIVIPIILFFKLFSLEFFKNPDHYFYESFFDSSNNLFIFLSEVLIVIVFIVLFIIFYKLISQFWSDEE
jgi:hypothetical protein